MWWKLKNTILQVCPESDTFSNNKEDFILYEKAAEEAWKKLQAVALRHVWNQCLEGSNWLLTPKDGIPSTNLLEKQGPNV